MGRGDFLRIAEPREADMRVWCCSVLPVEPLLLKPWWQACQIWQSKLNKQTYNAWDILILRKLLFIWNLDKLSILYFIYQNSLRLWEPVLLVNWNIWINIYHWLCSQPKISLDRCVRLFCCCLFVCFVLFWFQSLSTWNRAKVGKLIKGAEGYVFN